MARSKETVGKKEKEKKKDQKKRQKAQRREERQANSNKGKGLDEMLAYLDEDGNLTTTPPDPLARKKEIALEDIQLGAAKPDPEVDGPRKGIITFFNQDKGYGFINDLRSQRSIFVHINNMEEPLKERDKVSFEIEPGPKGPTAVNVKKIK